MEIDREVAEKAKELKVTIIYDKIIYHLYDLYIEHVSKWHEDEKLRLKDETVIPCIMKTLCIIHNRNPVIIGVKIIKGQLNVKQPMALVDGSQNGRLLGVCGGIEIDKVS